MGKSIRSKIKKRLRTAKRQRVDAMIVTPQNKVHHQQIQQIIQGRGVTLATPKNAFKYPNAEDAVFPQHEVRKPIDFRAENLPMAGYVFRGNRRKYEGEQLDYMNNLKVSHPEMEVMGGGGAILAKTGQRVEIQEAELLATAVQRPHDAGTAAAGLPSSTSAVAEAVREEMAPATGAAAVAMREEVAPATGVNPPQAAPAPAEMEVEVAEPENAADHSRRPVVKDTRRAERTAAHKPRANATKRSKRVVVKEDAPPPTAKEAPSSGAKEAEDVKMVAANSTNNKGPKKKGLKKKA